MDGSSAAFGFLISQMVYAIFTVAFLIPLRRGLFREVQGADEVKSLHDANLNRKAAIVLGGLSIVFALTLVSADADRHPTEFQAFFCALGIIAYTQLTRPLGLQAWLQERAHQAQIEEGHTFIVKVGRVVGVLLGLLVGLGFGLLLLFVMGTLMFEVEKGREISLGILAFIALWPVFRRAPGGIVVALGAESFAALAFLVAREAIPIGLEVVGILLFSTALFVVVILLDVQFVKRTTNSLVETLQIRSESERQAAELEEARKLQLSMLPSVTPDHRLIETAWRMRTATEVGGDYYDFRATTDDEFLLAVGDATGHGLQSGSVVTATKSLFHTVADEESLNDTLRTMSHGIRAMNFPRLGMAMAMLRIRENQLSITSAGMPPVLVHRASSGDVEEILLPGIGLCGRAGI